MAAESLAAKRGVQEELLQENGAVMADDGDKAGGHTLAQHDGAVRGIVETWTALALAGFIPRPTGGQIRPQPIGTYRLYEIWVARLRRPERAGGLEQAQLGRWHLTNSVRRRVSCVHYPARRHEER